MENLSFGSSRPTVLGCSCANKIPPSFVPTRPSALSGPCHTSFHCARAAMTPGIPVTVTCFSGLGCGKAPPVLCCATAITVDPMKQHAIVHIVLSFISSPTGLGCLARHNIPRPDGGAHDMPAAEKIFLRRACVDYHLTRDAA